MKSMRVSVSRERRDSKCGNVLTAKDSRERIFTGSRFGFSAVLKIVRIKLSE